MLVSLRCANHGYAGGKNQVFQAVESNALRRSSFFNAWKKEKAAPKSGAAFCWRGEDD
jgi:hypothetical protein